jgi:ribosome-binding factor A
MPTRSFHRTDRVNAELRREVGVLVHAAVRDHALPQASVVDVDVSRELDVATVWVTALQPERSAEVVKALKALAKEFRHQLAHTMRMRRVPELRFKYDDSVDKGERIERLLREEGDRGPGTGDQSASSSGFVRVFPPMDPLVQIFDVSGATPSFVVVSWR